MRPPKWEAVLNAFHQQPKSRANTRFYLYTRLNPSKAQELCIDDRKLLAQSNYNRKHRTILLISGWLDNRFFAKWVRQGISSLLGRGDFNVIYVAWKSINELFVAAMIIKKFSMDLADFIVFLKRSAHIPGESIHCIGHSLGAFLCGFTGDKTYIGRISGESRERLLSQTSGSLSSSRRRSPTMVRADASPEANQSHASRVRGCHSFGFPSQVLAGPDHPAGRHRLLSERGNHPTRVYARQMEQRRDGTKGRGIHGQSVPICSLHLLLFALSFA